MKQVFNPLLGNFDLITEPLKEPLTGLVKSAGTVASTDTILEAFNKTAANVENLEAKNVRCTRFAIIGSGTSGVITIAAGNTVVLDDFGDGADAVTSEIGIDGRPSYVSAQDANGTRVAVAFDVDGNYVLSHTPRAYPIGVVYRTRISLKLWNESDVDILGSYVETMPNHNNLFGLTGGTNINRSHYAQYATVAEAEAATSITTSAQCFVAETQKWYIYCTACNVTRDGGLVLNTGMGASTRWLAQIASNKFGETGWINTDSFVLTALNTTTVRVTLSSVGTYALASRRYEIGVGTYDVVISGVAGIKFIGINAAGALYFQDTLWNFDTQCPVAVAYWTGTAIAAAPQTEMHGLRDSVWHMYTHTYVGLQYRSGLTFTGSVQPDNNTNPDVDTVQYLWATDGVVQDEDIRATPGIGQWLQTLGSGLTSTTAGIFNFFYWNGTFITTANAMADRAPFIYTGVNGTPEWNNGGTLTPSVTGNYVVYHYFATPMVGGWAVFARPHNAVYTSLGLAAAARPSSLVWSNYAEVKHIHTAIFRVNTAWTTITHRCKLVSLQDFRTVLGGPVSSTAATDHNSLSNRTATLSHPASAIYGTNDGGVQFHDVATNGLLSSTDFLWNNSTKVMSIIGSISTTGDVTSSAGAASFAARSSFAKGLHAGSVAGAISSIALSDLFTINALPCVHSLSAKISEYSASNTSLMAVQMITDVATPITYGGITALQTRCFHYAASNSGALQGCIFVCANGGSGTTTSAYGGSFSGRNDSTGITTSAIGGAFTSTSNSTGTVTTGIAGRFTTSCVAGAVMTTAKGVEIDATCASSTPPTTLIGLDVLTLGTASATNKWAIRTGAIGDVLVQSTTGSLSRSTGSIVTNGGVSIRGTNLHLGPAGGGGLLSTVATQLGFYSGYDWTGSEVLASATSGGFIGVNFYNTGMAFSYDSGLTVGVTTGASAKVKMLITNTNVQFPQTTASTSTTTGCATFAGGVGIAGAVHIGGNFACNGVAAPARPTVNAACTDLTTAIALINQLRAALVANGIVV